MNDDLTKIHYIYSSIMIWFTMSCYKLVHLHNIIISMWEISTATMVVCLLTDFKDWTKNWPLNNIFY